MPQIVDAKALQIRLLAHGGPELLWLLVRFAGSIAREQKYLIGGGLGPHRSEQRQDGIIQRYPMLLLLFGMG